MNGQGSVWNRVEGLFDELKRCIFEKWSSRMTAEHLSEMAGQRITRNSVLGAAHRKGLAFQSVEKPKLEKRQVAINVNKVRRQFQHQINGLRETTAPDIPKEIPKQADFLGLTILEVRDSQCKFIHGETVEEYLCCGQPVVADSSYCGFHRQVTSIPLRH